MTELLIFLKRSPNFQKIKEGENLLPHLDSDFSLVAFFLTSFFIIQTGLKNLLPFYAKSLLGCQSMTQHRKTRKKFTGQDVRTITYVKKSFAAFAGNVMRKLKKASNQLYVHRHKHHDFQQIQNFIFKIHPFCLKFLFCIITHSNYCILEFYSKEPSFGLKVAGSKKK